MNNNNNSPSQSIVNPELNFNSLTKEKLNVVLQRAKQLQAAGEKEDGKNEFSQIMNLLRLLQQQQNTIVQQQPQATTSAGSNTDQRTLTPAELHQQQQLQLQLLQQHLLQQQALNGSQSPSGSGTTTPNGTPTNNNLQYQMMAYNLLSQKNSPVSKPVQSPSPAPQQTSTVNSPSDKDATPELPKSMAERLVEAIYQQAVEYNTNKKKKMPFMTSVPDKDDTQIVTVFDLLNGQQRSHAHASRQQRLLLPEETPRGLDPYTIIKERERRIETRVQMKLVELENRMDEDDQRQPLGYLLNEYYDDTVRTASPERLQSIVQLKSLQLREKQAKLREEVVKNMEEANRLASSVDRTSYRKIMKRQLREARMTEKLERQQRIDREKKEKQRHLDYLQSVCNQGRDLITWHKSHQAKMVKLGKAILQYHAHVDKEEQRRQDKRSKDRIKALRDDDEEAYLKLIDEAKDTRLTQLLRQTGTYLESLTKAVVDQQTENASYDDDHDSMEEVDEETMLTDSHGNKVDYYKMAHRIREDVSQPNMLVGGTLKEYQIKGLQWMVSLYNNRLNGILADEMGLGKTIQTISLITYLIEKKRQNGPFLIIVPLSTLTNWSLEFEKWAPSVSMVCYKGTPDVRKSIQKKQIKHRDFQVLLTTFDYIIKDRPVLCKIKWQYMIIDEGHRMKNTQSKLNMVLRQYYFSRYRLILTGTPLQNNLPELWAILNFILPKIFNSVKSFEEWFNTPFSNQGVQDKVELNEEEQLLIIKRLHKVLRPFLLRRLKRDVESELPDKIERVIKCKLSSLQTHLYTQMKRNGTLYTADAVKGKSGVKGLNNTIMQLRKICNHPFVFEEVENMVNPSRMSNELLYRTSGKFELLDRMLPKLKETGHRVLIFFQMTQVMSIMEDFLNYKRYQYLRLDGSTKADDRSELLRLFNAPESPYFVFLLSTRAGGLGLNLQTADTVIIFDSDWNPHQDLQAQDRAHRIGQTKEVRIFRLISTNSVEEKILARANYKLDIDSKVIQAGKFDNRSTDEDREAFLRSMLEDKVENNSEGDDEDIDDEELNEMLQRSDTDMEVFHRMDKEREEHDARYWQAIGRHGKPERLITEAELPEVYLHDDIPSKEDDPLALGQRQRARENVRYTDGMTEEQWLNSLEEDDDSLGKKRARPKKGDSESKPKKSRNEQVYTGGW